MQGCYIDSDGPRSLYRCCAAQGVQHDTGRRIKSGVKKMGKTVSFLQMKDGTRDDYLMLDKS